MADDGGDVTLYWFRNNSSQKRSLKYWRTQLTTCLVSNKSMLTKKAMPDIQREKANASINSLIDYVIRRLCQLNKPFKYCVTGLHMQNTWTGLNFR